MVFSFSPTIVYTTVLFLLIIGFVLWLVVMQIQEYYQQDDPILKVLLEKVKPIFEGDNYSGLLTELNKRNILKEITLYKGDKSYTINKQKVYLCLKDERKIPLTPVQEPIAISNLETQASDLAKFLDVKLENI